MKNDNNEEKQEKPILKTSIINTDVLYEMVFDRTTNKTSFSKMSRDGNLENGLEEVELEGRK